MKKGNNCRFNFIYVLAAFTTAAGGLKIYFVAYVDHWCNKTRIKSNYTKMKVFIFVQLV